MTVAENERARQLFSKAVTIDSAFSSPHVGLSQTYVRDTLYFGTRPTLEAGHLAIEAARKAVAIDPNDPAAQAALSSAFITAGDFAAALIAVDRALTLDRNSAGAHEVKGAVLIQTGHYAEGRAEELIALRLNPRDPISCVGAALVAASYYYEEAYDAAVEAAKKCLFHYPTYPAPRRYIAAALAQLGRREEAAAALDEFVRSAPEWVEINVRNRPPFYRPKEYEHIRDGLRKAGWRD